jgi:hypothetical protein
MSVVHALLDEEVLVVDIPMPAVVEEVAEVDADK